MHKVVSKRKEFIGIVACIACLLSGSLAGAKTTIRIAHWWSGDTFRPALAEFMKEYPDIEVKEEQSPFDTHHNKIVLGAAAGTGPDVYLASIQYFGTLVKMGVFYPLDDFIGRDGLDLNKFAPNPMVGYGYRGRLYGLPIASGGGFYSLWVNKKLTDAAGIDVPELGRPNFDTWHWKDFLVAAQKTTRVGPGGTFEQWGCTAPDNLWTYMQFIWENGGELFDEINPIDPTLCRLDERPAIDAVQFLIDLVHKYKVTSMGVSLAPSAYLSGKVAFTWGWFIYPLMAEAPFDWTVIHVPWEKRKIAEINGNMWAINANSKNKDAAWTLVKWLTTSESACERIAPKISPIPYGPVAQDYINGIKNRQQQKVYLTKLSRALHSSNAVLRIHSLGPKNSSEIARLWEVAINCWYRL